MATRSRKLQETVNRVLGLELLRDMILDYAIHGEEENKTISNICSFRLVCKDWLRSTSRILLQCQKPLFVFKFFLDDDIDGEQGNVLDEFVSAVSGSRGLHDRVPPFAIRAETTHILEVNRQKFSNSLVHCSSGLVELSLEIPNEKPAFVMEQDLLFPKLRIFKVTVYDEADWWHHSDFIQSVLDGCQQLKTFELTDYSNCIYPGRFFTLPSSMTELSLTILNKNFEVVELSCVPTLKRLTLKFTELPLRNGIITCILEKVRKSLESFDINYYKRSFGRVTENPVATFRLPLMEKLERLEIRTGYLKLEEDVSSLEQLVPVLSHMDLSSHSFSAFRKWTDSSCFSSVTSLVICLPSLARNGHLENGALHLMRNVKRALPNIRKLEISLYAADASALVFVMKEMRALQELMIHALDTVDNRGGWDLVPQFWDALFLGIPPDSVVALNKSPKLWGKLQNENTLPILNLSDLHTLGLTNVGGYEFELSSAVFKHALLQMPNLTNLVLLGRDFVISEKNKKAWSKQGKSIEGFFNDHV